MTAPMPSLFNSSWPRAKPVSGQFKDFPVPGKNYLCQRGSGETERFGANAEPSRFCTSFGVRRHVAAFKAQKCLRTPNVAG
jgi:saccharopine dehydrogenase-like NADP-dependent oxidoreductase